MLDKEIKRKPEWIRHKLAVGENFNSTKSELREKGLYTVCEEAKCPNISECWAQKTATMMILGDTCTRGCKFCNVKTGNPKGFVDPQEIENASRMVSHMGLKYLVVTSVDRDDLADFGSSHFAAVVERIRKDHPETYVEVLIPDFNVDETAMRILADSKPFVVAQNIETVKRLTHPVRDPRAGYEKTLTALDFYKKNYPHIATKSSIMVGLGETRQELTETMKDLRAVDVNILTLGQYLQPSRAHLGVQKFYHPDIFEELKTQALELGFEFVASGPMVRSSYKAADYLEHLRAKGHDL